MKKTICISSLLSALLVISFYSLTGCNTSAKDNASATKKEVQTIQDATKASDKAANKVDNTRAYTHEVETKQLARTLSNINAASDTAAQLPASHEAAHIQGELSLAQKRLDSVKADEDETERALERKSLIDKGLVEEYAAALGNAKLEAEARTRELVAARVAEQIAIKERDAARARETQTVEAMTKKMNDERIAEQKQNKTRAIEEAKTQAVWLRVFAALCVVAVVVISWVGKLDGFVSSWPFVVGAAVCLGLAQLVMETWFKYAVMGGMLIAAGVVGWVVYSRYAEKKRVEDESKKAQQLTSTLEKMVPTLDIAYNNATKDQQAFLDASVFDVLSEHKMTQADKQTVKNIRATAPSHQ